MPDTTLEPEAGQPSQAVDMRAEMHQLDQADQAEVLVQPQRSQLQLELLHLLLQEEQLHQDLADHPILVDARLEPTTNVQQAHLDQKEFPETLDCPVLMDWTEFPEKIPKTSHPKHTMLPPASTAQLALLVLQVPLANPDKEATRELMDNLVCQGVMVSPDIQENKVQPAQLVVKVHRDIPERRDWMVVNHSDVQDQRVKEAPAENAVKPATQERMVVKGPQVLKERLERLAQSVQLEFPAVLVKKAKAGDPERMQNTAHVHQNLAPTEVSMEVTVEATVERMAATIVNVVLKHSKSCWTLDVHSLLSFLLFYSCKVLKNKAIV